MGPGYVDLKKVSLGASDILLVEKQGMELKVKWWGQRNRMKIQPGSVYVVVLKYAHNSLILFLSGGGA